MVTIRKCAFCGENINPGTGIMFVDATGAVVFYCSSKCEKNVFLKRSPRKVKWTQAYRKEKAIRVQHLKDSKAGQKPAEAEKKPETRGSRSEPARSGSAAREQEKAVPKAKK